MVSKAFFFPIRKYHTTDRGVRYQYSTSHWQVISVENTGLKPDCDWVNNVPVVVTNSLGESTCQITANVGKTIIKSICKIDAGSAPVISMSFKTTLFMACLSCEVVWIICFIPFQILLPSFKCIEK